VCVVNCNNKKLILGIQDGYNLFHSSGVLRQNYVGLCQLDVFNLCHTEKTHVVNTTFQLYDGKFCISS
jgi:hypothetical protein